MPRAKPIQRALTPFEGADVAQTTMRLVGAGDGLSKALAIEPAEHHIGDKVRMVIEGTVKRVHHDPIGDTDVLVRVHTIKAGTIAIVDAEFAEDVLERQRIAIEQAQGVHRIPGINSGEAADPLEDGDDG